MLSNRITVFFHKISHYAVRSVFAIFAWVISFVILIKMPIFFVIENGKTQIASPIPLLAPFLIATGVFFLAGLPLNKSKLFYNPEIIKRKAQTYINAFDRHYRNSLCSKTVTDFLVDWMGAEVNMHQLCLLSKKLSETQYQALCWQKNRMQELQWKLCDAIDRAVAIVLSDLDTTYKHNRPVRADMFFGDIRIGLQKYSLETLHVVWEALQKVAAKANVHIPADLLAIAPVSQKTKTTVLDPVTDLQSIDYMDGAQFELWCANFLSKIGYSEVSLTGKSGDQGVDLLAQKDGIKYAIQCKCYSSDLGNTPVQEVNTGKIIYNCHVGAVLTNRRFTTGGKEAAKATGVLLWDRDWIYQKMSSISHSNEKTKDAGTVSDQNVRDSLYYDAVNIILETECASVSTLQRNLNIGYARAARLIDEMEENGVVGPFRGSKPREILIQRIDNK